MTANLLLILIAPNVSEQMGGEAIKALQSFQELKKLHPDTLQITHARNRAEVARNIILQHLQELWKSGKLPD